MGAGVLTAAAVLLVLVALTFPDRIDLLHPSAFLRLPAEALVYLLVILLIPARFHALRTCLALVAGLLLGLTEVFTVQWISSTWRDAAAFTMMFLILLIRPRGLLGKKAVREA